MGPGLNGTVPSLPYLLTNCIEEGRLTLRLLIAISMRPRLENYHWQTNPKLECRACYYETVISIFKYDTECVINMKCRKLLLSNHLREKPWCRSLMFPMKVFLPELRMLHCLCNAWLLLPASLPTESAVVIWKDSDLGTLIYEDSDHFMTTFHSKKRFTRFPFSFFPCSACQLKRRWAQYVKARDGNLVNLFLE